MKAINKFINEKLQTSLTGDNAVYKDLVYALILIVIVVYNNAPALKNFREKYNFKNIIADFKNKKRDFTKERDDEAKWDRVPTKIDVDEVVSTVVAAPKKSDSKEVE